MVTIAGLALRPDGGLIITDDQRGRVWLVGPEAPDSTSTRILPRPG